MSEDCQKCGTAMWDLDDERLCPGCSDTQEGSDTTTNDEVLIEKVKLLADKQCKKMRMFVDRTEK